MRKSELAWVLADYSRYEEEPPERIVASPEQCEGLLMSDEEVETYITDGVLTIRVLNQKASPRAGEVQKMFLADLEFLYLIGRIDEDDYNDLIREENFYL